MRRCHTFVRLTSSCWLTTSAIAFPLITLTWSIHICVAVVKIVKNDAGISFLSEVVLLRVLCESKADTNQPLQPVCWLSKVRTSRYRRPCHEKKCCLSHAVMKVSFPDPQGEKMEDTGDTPNLLNMGSKNFKRGLWFGHLSFGSSQVGQFKGASFWRSDDLFSENEFHFIGASNSGSNDSHWLFIKMFCIYAWDVFTFMQQSSCS